jgi:hypothetical protein
MSISKIVEDKPYKDKIVFLVKLNLMLQDHMLAQKDHLEINTRVPLLQRVSDYSLLKAH